MKKLKWASGSNLSKTMKAQFVAGIFVVVPVGAAILILVWIFITIDNVLQPVLRPLLGHTIPGLGFVITIILIYLVGVMTTNVIGKRLLRYGESLLSRMPLFRYLYTGIKQILGSFSNSSEAGFLQVVLVEFPKKGLRAIGFVTSESYDRSGEKFLSIFIPTSPNPTSGYLELVREQDIIRTDISIDDAFKIVLSAGKVSLKGVSNKMSAEL